jgi:predicted dehydrogenase/threonine dehydrogenase-like Zn-dependent dehydrogenase
MKQIIQNYRTGKVELAEVPVPLCPPNSILVKNQASLISIGTERSIIELGQKSLLGKARARPDLVKRFLDKAKKEGFVKTFKEALGRLDNPTPLGYSSAGKVIEVGKNIRKFSPGDRVTCIGAGFASHAEYITVPENLCQLIPDNITYDEASFGMLGIIALHGVRCVKITFGESVAVIGLGLLGLLTVQLLKAYGCKVIGMDIERKKVEMAGKLGAAHAFLSEEEFKNGVERITNGNGVDAVIITAATKSSAPVNNAVDIVRYGGRVVIVGVVDIHPHRNEMWHKEVEIMVAKGGGAGIFDPFYENKGVDYPIGYVRWTENRNLKEFLRLVSIGRIDLKPLITHKFQIEDALKVYESLIKGNLKNSIGVILNYAQEKEPNRSVSLKTPAIKIASDEKINLGVIGAGLFGKTLLLPTLKKMRGVRLHAISTSSGASAYHTGKRYGFERCTADYKEILENRSINGVIILTPHSLHAKMVIESLQMRKHIFVEKPLCINKEELTEIMKTYSSFNDKCLMVGYNRRFSPHSIKVEQYLKDRSSPLVINYRINAGFIPADHWVHSEEEGGGRIVGEICHFVDMMQFLTKSEPIRVYAERVTGDDKTVISSDNVGIVIKFKDGSVGNIIYSASGDKAFSREQIEIFCESTTIVLTDYRKTLFYKGGKRNVFRTANQEIGYKEELQHFIDVIKGNSTLKLLPKEIFFSTLSVFEINNSLRRGVPIEIQL